MRFTTSHPKDFTPKVADAFGRLRALSPWLHLPVQSGSSRTLRQIVRDYTLETVYAEGLGTVDDFPNLTAALAARGFREDEIRKILGENFLRVFEQVWRG